MLADENGASDVPKNAARRKIMLQIRMAASLLALLVPLVVLTATLSGPLQNAAFAQAKTGPFERLQKIDPEQLGQAAKEWISALRSVTNEDMDRSEMIQFPLLLVSMNQLFEGDKFQTDESRKYVARIRQVPMSMILDWQSAMESASGEKPSRTNAVLYIVRHEPLFDGSKLGIDEQHHPTARLRSLPKAAVSKWASVAGVEEPIAAFSLIGLEEMFIGDKFQDGVFQQAVASDSATVKAMLNRGLYSTRGSGISSTIIGTLSVVALLIVLTAVWVIRLKKHQQQDKSLAIHGKANEQSELPAQEQTQGEPDVLSSNPASE
jgi:hypothetical protein